MKTFLKILGGIIALLILIVGGVLGYYSSKWPTEYPDTPYPEIAATSDSAAIAVRD